jgi:phosphomannomutase
MMRVHLAELIENSGVRFGTSGARGLVAEMTDAVCYAYASAFLQAVVAPVDKVVLGHDLRPSSPQISAACATAIVDAGREVVYVGALPTPAIAFFAAQIGAPAIVVTGSHIPFDRNGIKFYRSTGEISKADEQAILDAIVEIPDSITLLTLPVADEIAGNVYIRRYDDFFGENALAGFKVAVYEHSSVARDILRRILEGLGAEVISLGRTDTFVPIDTEAVRAEDIQQAVKWAQEVSFDAILSTDGDADRPLIGDELGHWLRGDLVGILCAQYLQAAVVVTPVSSNTAVEKCGSFSQVLRTRIGSPYVIAGMEEAFAQGKDRIVGYEANGGFLLGSNIQRGHHSMASLPTRDAVLPMLALLCMARERNCKLSQLKQGLPERYTASDRLQNFATDKSKLLMERLLAMPEELQKILAPHSGAVRKIDQTDGLRVTFESDDIVHLRPSGNAPELRCYAEAGNPEQAKRLCDACLARVAKVA